MKRRCLKRRGKRCIKWSGTVKKVYLGKSYRGTKIVKKKPKRSIRIASLSHFTRYVRGTEEFVVPRKGVKLIHE